MKKTFITLTVFLIGLGVLSYPVISDWYNTGKHYGIVSEYDEEIEKLDRERLEAEREKVQEFNQSIDPESAPLTDPFSESGGGEEVHGGYYDVLNIGEAMGYVEIDKIDVRLPIYHGTSEDVLSEGAGHMSNTSLPGGGESTHSVITAHRGLPSTRMFRDLDEIEIGDTFLVTTLGQTRAYEVDQVKVVLPHETEALGVVEGEEYTTLITCTPYGINTHRMLVRGHNIPYTPPVVAEEQGLGTNYSLWIILASSAALILYLGSKWIRRIRKGHNEEIF